MSHNPLAPGYVKLHYTSSFATHVQVIPVNPYLGVGDVWFLSENGDSVGSNFSAAISNFMAVWLPLVPTTTSYSLAELWSQPTPEDIPINVQTVSVGSLGSNAAAAVKANQRTITYRTNAGGRGSLQLMDTFEAANTRDNYPFVATSYNTLATWLLGAQGWVAGRDNGYPVAILRYIIKSNNHLRRQYGFNNI